jgi:DNA-3-methyladenine glycosylase I
VPSLVEHADGRARCSWCGLPGQYPDYLTYHDDEWGRPLADERRIFEKLVLEGFQSGLSWLTILRKRAAFRRAFADFDAERMAGFGATDVARLVADPGIVRHRGKIEAAITNARALLALHARGERLAAWLWQHEPPPAERPPRLTPEALAALPHSAQSKLLAKRLKQAGFVFVGPTTVYALMQSAGVVNDHLHGCAVRAQIEAERAAFAPPV